MGPGNDDRPSPFPGHFFTRGPQERSRMETLWIARRRYHHLVCEANLTGPPFYLVMKDAHGEVIRDSSFDVVSALRSRAAAWWDLIEASGFAMSSDNAV